MSHYGVPDTTDGRFVDQFSDKYYYFHAEPYSAPTGIYGYIQASVQCCPVCKGKGTVPPGFYQQNSYPQLSIGTGPETCRSCDGKGYIIVK